MSSINSKTTVQELIDLGLFEPGMVDVWNSRLARRDKKSERETQVSEISSFILSSLQQGQLYKTGNFIKPVIENFGSFFESESSQREKDVAAHKLITLSLKSLTDSGDLVVVNKTNNHAHNKYGLTPDLEALPSFAEGLEDDNQ